ncbi:hypothetical protein So717_02140 [Roseobacter cerasinus]|uniref:Acetolactate synthase n=1 Tax=Roseobacter cerasinus TaxID=2602289 RepID=A0A640VMZ9_9RHOB|nr:DUF6497 family protein [Roseobacter cerasinus]GFE48461.1 hypothetical protein So717_02140 [Roseobacter cerasinus]
MSVAPAIAFAAAGAVPVFEVPSGQPVTLYEVLTDRVGEESWLRFRFLAPEIARDGGSVSFADAEPDLEHLCTAVALPYMADYGLAADIVAVTLLDRDVPFGSTDPDATQFIDIFRVSSGVCVWEGL